MREILVVDRETGLPKRIDGTIPEWALDRKKRAEAYCDSQGWPTDFNKLSLDQLSEVLEALEQPA